MTSVASQDSAATSGNSTNQRANALADRLEQGARALAEFAAGLSDAAWQTRVPKDGRKVGVTVHHVASVYPIEIQLAQTLAEGKPVTTLHLTKRGKDALSDHVEQLIAAMRPVADVVAAIEAEDDWVD